MGQASVVTQQLFSLIDTISSAKMSVSHESCEIQRKKLLHELSTAHQNIQLLNQQWNEHVCWNGQNQSKHPEEISRYLKMKHILFLEINYFIGNCILFYFDIVFSNKYYILRKTKKVFRREFFEK